LQTNEIQFCRKRIFPLTQQCYKAQDVEGSKRFDGTASLVDSSGSGTMIRWHPN
jgi:hypothetical protein